jgi:hypothetical protein
MVGYTTYVSDNIPVYSGRETVLEIALGENLQAMGEVVVTPKVEKELPLNRQAAVSVRMLGSEEANRYAGSWGDVGRMVANPAGWLLPTIRKTTLSYVEIHPQDCFGVLTGKQFFAGLNHTRRFTAATRMENRFSYQLFITEMNTANRCP